MHVAELSKPVQWAGHSLQPGRYWLEDRNAAELLWGTGGTSDVRLTHTEPPTFDPGALWKNGSRVLVVRVGGFGDLIWLNSIYAAMRAAGVRIAHSCFTRYAPVLDGFVDEKVAYPLSESIAQGYDTVVWLENVIESSPCVDNEHPATRLARVFQVPAPLEKLCQYQIAPEEILKAGKRWPRTPGKRRVCVQTSASVAAKSYPHTPRLLADIHSLGVEILLVGEPRPRKENVPPDVWDATQARLSIRESIAMAARCDAIVAPDSVFIHAGAALGIPVVGLFGPFCAKSYMQGAPGIGMQGRAKCSPCSWHGRGTPFPPDRNCSKLGICVALDAIPSHDVTDMLKKILNL